ncbi:MAG: trypsin-like serine protease [Deltaproteobacteria bacterium]|nr:trypsin-like serine protease [Deltaproteobacteria bacterium]
MKLTMASLLVTAGCGAASEETEVRADSIVGGAPAEGRRFESVGALVTFGPDGAPQPFCTATLVSNRVAVTAKHCLLLTPLSQPIGFALGSDGLHPDRVVPVLHRSWERTLTAGVMSLGSDVAAVYLAEPVRRIRTPYAAEAQAWEVGRRFRAVGFGAQSYTDLTVPGLRREAVLELAAIGPSAYFPAVYRDDFDAYLADLARGFGTTADDPAITPVAQAIWDGTLLEPHADAVFLRVTGNTAPGDSGGPIFAAPGRSRGDDPDESRGALSRTVGVTSGVIFVSGSYPDSVVESATVYSTFGPEALHLLRSAEACPGVPEEGKCHEGTLYRCSSLSETRHHPTVLSEDCTATGRACEQAPSGARCAPACASDADCASGGTCAGGTCAWSPAALCTGEGAPGACYLCCLGQATSLSFAPEEIQLCADTCYGPSFGEVSRGTVERAVRLPGLGEIRLR